MNRNLVLSVLIENNILSNMSSIYAWLSNKDKDWFNDIKKIFEVWSERMYKCHEWGWSRFWLGDK
jgi:hypothetical protein